VIILLLFVVVVVVIAIASCSLPAEYSNKLLCEGIDLEIS
jgi:hypothetical protein